MVTEVERLAVRIEADIRALRAGLRQATQQTDRASGSMARSFRRADRAISNTSKGVRGLRLALASIGLGLTIRQTIRAADSYTLLNARIGLVTDSASQQRDVFERLFRVSQETRTGLDATTTVYTRLARASDDLGLTQTDLLTITRALNQAVVVSGASAQESQAALIQLSQAFQSGALRGDEFRSVSEQTPRILQAIADGAGIARQDLRRLAAEGALSAGVVARALLAEAGTIEEEFERIPRTIGQALTQLSNETLKAVGELDQASGSAQALGDSIASLAESFNSPQFKQARDDFAGFLAETVDFYAQLLQATPPVTGRTAQFATAIELAGMEVGELNEELAALEAQLASLEGGGRARGAAQSRLQSEIRRVRAERDGALAALRELQASDRTRFGGAGLEARLNTRGGAPAAAPAEDPQIAEAREKGRQRIESTVAALEREAQILSTVESEREALRVQLDLEQVARQAGVENIDEFVSRARAAIAITQQQARESELAAEVEQKLADAISQRAAVETGLQDELSALRARVAFRGEETEELRVQLRLIELRRELEGNIPPEIERQVRAVERARTEVANLEEAINAQSEGTKRLGEIAEQMGFSFSSAFEGAIVGGKSASDVLRALDQDIQTILIRGLVTQPLFGGIAAGVQGETIPGGGLGGFVSGGIASGISGLRGLFGAQDPINVGNLTVGGGGSAEESGGALVSVFEELKVGGESLVAAFSATESGASSAGSSLAGDLVGSVLETVGVKTAEAAGGNAAAVALAEVAAAGTAAAAALAAVGSAGSSEGAESLVGVFAGRAGGGPVMGPGSGTSDSVPIMASRGEFVVRESVARRNMAFLDALNAGRIPGFAQGGAVMRVPNIPPAGFRDGGRVGNQVSVGGASIVINMPQQPGGVVGSAGFLGTGLPEHQLLGMLAMKLREADRKRN